MFLFLFFFFKKKQPNVIYMVYGLVEVTVGRRVRVLATSQKLALFLFIHLVMFFVVVAFLQLLLVEGQRLVLAGSGDGKKITVKRRAGRVNSGSRGRRQRRETCGRKARVVARELE